MHEVTGDPGENIDRLAAFLEAQGIQLVYNENIAPALGMSYGGRIAILPGQSKAEEFSTLVHETAHEMLHKAERRTATTKTVRETEAEAVAFVVGKAVGLVTGTASADYIHLYHGNASLLAESLEVIQQTASVILAALEPPLPNEDRAGRRRRTGGGGVMETILAHPQSRPEAGTTASTSRSRTRPIWRLVIEAMDESGPCGLPALSVAHYGEQNGDPMRDPEMCFELGIRRRRAPEPVLLAQRLRRRRAVEPLHRARPLRRSRRSCTSSMNASPRRGTTTCDRRASPKPSRTSAFVG